MVRLSTFLLLGASAALQATAQTPEPARIFGTNGCIDIPYSIFNQTAFKSHALQPDGKLLLAGWGGDGFPYEARMARIDTACGDLDPTFGQNGVRLHFFEARTLCHAIALQADGKIVGGGTIAASNAGSGQFPGVFRYNADGSVDSTFNGTGYNNTGFSSGQLSGTVQDLFIMNDGRILAAVMGYSKLGAFRYLPDGTLDTTYSADGRAEMPVNYTPGPEIIAGVMDPDGSLTLAGLLGTSPFEPYFMGLTRFMPDGQPDTTFGANGLAVHPTVIATPGNPEGYKDWDIVRRPGGGFLVAYGVQLGVTSPSVVAFTDSGTVDSTYATNGIYHFADDNASGSGLLMETDGSAMLFIKHNFNAGPGAIVKLTPAGQPDPAFGTNGVLLAPFGPPQDNRGFVDGFRLPGGDLIAYGNNTNGSGMVVRFSLNAEANALPVISYVHPHLVVSGGGSIQWFLDGEPINGATGSTHSPTQNGTYTVEMNSFGCVNTSPPFQFLSVGIADVEDVGITFRQDLAAGRLFIQNDAAATDWLLVDASGRALRQGVLRSGANEVSTTDLRSGVYLLRCGGLVHRFVVQ
ncbi:MAG TPA: hypothetical protein PKY96_06220 [Flavobacteriales bacterium]|nr:hypothetical protein [Flavobacteriales bacterium]